jgi:diguanylate cyclase (GGDEF)-like protein/PAS domain S-box-containing protein
VTTSARTRNRPRGDVRRWAGPLAWLVLVVGLVASVAIAGAWGHRNSEETDGRLRESLGRASASVDRELRRYEDLLRGINSAFDGERVTSARLERYLKAAQLESRYPAAAEVVLVEPLRGRDSLVASAVAPRAGTVPAGLDLGRVAEARDALESSRDTGAGTLSLPWSTMAAERPSVALVLPFYSRKARSAGARRDLLSGWLTIRFRPGRFLDSAFLGGGLVQLKLTMADAPAGGLIAMRRGDERPEPGAATQDRVVRTRGRDLVLRAEALPGFAAGGAEPRLVLIFGSLLSLLLAALVQALARSEARARRLANATVDALLDFEERFRSLAATPVGIFRADAEGRLTYGNERFAEIVGIPVGDALGMHWCELADDRDGDNALAIWDGSRRNGDEASVEFRLNGSDRDRWLACRLAPLGEGWVGSLEEVSERKRQQAELERRATRDPLTELPNRKHFLERLGRALPRAERRGTRLAVMFVDLDGFKAINDEHGHAAGDIVLLAVAGRLAGAMRDGDTVARFGGDEFAILCERLEDAADAASAGRRLAAALEEPITIEGGTVDVTLSVGIAVGPAPNVTPDMLIRAADEAMYRAKADGRTFELVDISPLDWAAPSAPDLVLLDGGEPS